MSEIKKYCNYLYNAIKPHKNISVLRTGSISYTNWWNANPDEIWFTQFFKSSLKNPDTRIEMFSLFGSPRNVHYPSNGIKIFFTGENVKPFSYSSQYADIYSVKKEYRRMREYGNYCVDNVDLALGFSIEKAKNYMRFPLWILYIIDPVLDYERIRFKLDEINSLHNNFHTAKSAALFARHDKFGTRSEIYYALKNIIQIDCPSLFQHNTPVEYVDNKIAYLRNYKFNVCPENVDSPGYITEKLLEAFCAGTIPIYLGSTGWLEPDIINPEAVLVWNLNGDNTEVIQKILRLDQDEAFYQQFCKIPKFRQGAANAIFKMLNALSEQVEQIAENKTV